MQTYKSPYLTKHIDILAYSKLSLTSDEIQVLDSAWDFCELFLIDTFCPEKFRMQLINKIRKTYTIQEFFTYELIIEKLFWKLRHRTETYFTKNRIKMIDETSYSLIAMNKLLDHDGYKNCFINKLVMWDDRKYVYHYKKMEGSMTMFPKPNSRTLFNLVTMFIMFDRKLYREIIDKPSLITDVVVHGNFFELDFAFPNLNLMQYRLGSDAQRTDRIKKMYYAKDAPDNWYKLIDFDIFTEYTDDD